MNRLILAAAVLTAFSGCQKDHLTVLTQVTQLSANVACPAGGVVIASGADVDANGTLSADEIEKSYNVCNGVSPAAGKDGADGKNGADGVMGAMGTPGAAGVSGKNAPVPLTATTLLAAGDVNCPSGGVRLDFGLDVGLDGGVGDGQLQGFEIQATRSVCNGTTPVYAQPASAPEGSVGTATLVANGGTSLGGNGGPGGTIEVAMRNGSLGGNVTVFATGGVDAGFVMPAVTFEPGPRPMHVARDTTLRVFASLGEGLASNEAYFNSSDDGRTYRRASDGGVDEVTGIDIDKNVTLTLSTTPFNSMQLILRNDFRNSGTVNIDNGRAGRPMIRLYTSQFIGTRDSSVVGSDATSGSGDWVLIGTPRFVNEGAFTLRGVDTMGGLGGSLLVLAKELFNAAPLDVAGGSSSIGAGGPGGALLLVATELANRGAMALSGGAGVTRGGPGGRAFFESDGHRLRNSGRIVGRGGACSGAACESGTGGAVNVNVVGGETVWSAEVDCSGASGVASGGAGGSFTLAAVSDSNGQAPKTVHVSGSIAVSGGDGQTAGSGGTVTVSLDSGDFAEGAGLELLGYSAVSVNGGQGSVKGGAGGSISMLTAASTRGGVVIGPTGAVVVSAQFKLVGGIGVIGGSGGRVVVGSKESEGFGRSIEYVTNLGPIDARGGVGSARSGPGGDVSFTSIGAIHNQGDVTVSGGSGSTDFGGGGGRFTMSAGREATNAGQVRLEGGTARRGGGSAGQVAISGAHVVNTGALQLRGGDGAETGGDGSFSTMTSSMSPTENTGLLTLHGGAGATPGRAGLVYFDGVYLYR